MKWKKERNISKEIQAIPSLKKQLRSPKYLQSQRLYLTITRENLLIYWRPLNRNNPTTSKDNYANLKYRFSRSPSSNSSLTSLAVFALADFRKIPVVLGPHRNRCNNSSITAFGTTSSSEQSWFNGNPNNLRQTRYLFALANHKEKGCI